MQLMLTRHYSQSKQQPIISQEQIDALFPKRFKSEKHMHLTSEKLQQFYEPKVYSQNLINCIYRCHKSQIVEFYTNFIKKHHIKTEEPQNSYLFPNEVFPKLHKIKEYLKNKQNYPYLYVEPVPNHLGSILDQLYAEYGYVPNLERLLLFFPKYLEKHLELQKSLFETDILPLELIYFVCFCAAAQLGCIYTMTRMLKKFKQVGGEMQWIVQKKYPKKLIPLLELSRKMGRSLWEINENYIQEALIVGQFNPRQFMHLCQVIAFVHNVCTIAMGTGLIQEENIDVLEMNEIRKARTTFAIKQYPTTKKQKLSDVLDNVRTFHSVQKKDCSKRSQKKINRHIQNQANIQKYMREIAQELRNQQLYDVIHKSLNGLLPPYQLLSKRKDRIYKPIQASDFNFNFNAYPILNSIVGQSSNSLISLVNYSFDMTKYTFGSSLLGDYGTKGFRKAIRFYSQNLLGFTHNQYDYRTNFEKYLTMPLKFQIRLLTYSPLHITQQVLSELCHQQGEIGLFDNAHTAILVGSTKMQLALTMLMMKWQNIQDL